MKFFAQRSLCSVGLALAASLIGGLVSAQTPQSWDDVVAAAKSEHEIIVWGLVGEERRHFWKDAFEKENPGLTVRLFQADNLSERDTRYIREFDSGVAKVDVLVGGTAGMMGRLKPAGKLQALKPLLRPDILAADHWSGQGPVWTDVEQRYTIVSDLTPAPAVAVNQSIDVNSLQTWQDLLDSRFDGKIVMGDPRQAGPSFAMALFFYYDPDLGPDYVAKFFAKGRIVFATDERQMAEWVDSGRMLATIYPRQREVEALQAVGGKLRVIDALKANGVPQTIVVGSDGAIGVPNLDPLPHPNATRVYANWLYSREGQQAMIDSLGIASTRTDVDDSKLGPLVRRRPGVKYTVANDEALNATERAVAMREAVTKAVDER